MAGAGNLIFFENFRKTLGDGTIDLDSHVFKLQLHSSSFTPNVSTMQVRADLTGELSTANGYTSGGASLASITWTKSGATVTWDAADTVFTATGAGITARYGVILDDSTASKDLVGYILLDTAPADVTATAGNTMTFQWNAAGIFTQT